MNSTAQKAQLVKNVAEIAQGLDSFFLAVMSFISVLIQPGLALLFTSINKSRTIVLHFLLNFCSGALFFWLLGYGLAFGKGNAFIGTSQFLAIDVPERSYVFIFFQVSFAVASSSLILGVSETMNVTGFLIINLFTTCFLYPVVCHWVWTPHGWLSNLGFRDFAGSGVVWMSGGVNALSCAHVLGLIKRKKLDSGQDDIQQPTVRSDMMIYTSSVLIFLGFMAFNCGSQYSISKAGYVDVLGNSFLSTLVSGSSSALVASTIYWLKSNEWSIKTVLDSFIAGMVSVAAGCDAFHPWAASFTGGTAGLIYIGLIYVEHKINIQDPSDALAIYAAPGFWGLVACPLFRKNGVFLSGFRQSTQMLLWNFIGGITLISWNLSLMWSLCHTINLFGLLRLGNKEGHQDLHRTQHMESMNGIHFLNKPLEMPIRFLVNETQVSVK